MSNALAIAAVTATLKDLISDGLAGLDLSAIGSVGVSALPLDRMATGETEPNQLNLFLYQVSSNAGWRTHALPARDGSGQRIANPPLALDLHYLLTAYGAQELGADALLGLGMQTLHENPGLDRARLRAVLGGATPPFGNFSALGLADQVESLKITPLFLGTDELSKLWTAAQARYRPSMAYQVSVVLIESDAAARAALPVLRRGQEDRGPITTTGEAPQLESLANASSAFLRSARLGDTLVLAGRGLDTEGSEVLLENAHTGTRQILPVQSDDDPRRLRVPLPALADAGVLSAWTPGVYTIRLRTTRPGLPALSSPPLALMLAPSLEITPLAAAAGAAFALTLRCRPRLHPSQHAGTRVVLGARELPLDSIDTPADPDEPSTLRVEIPAELATAGSHPVILRVDGVQSVPVDFSQPAMQFDPNQTVVIG